MREKERKREREGKKEEKKQDYLGTFSISCRKQRNPDRTFKR